MVVLFLSCLAAAAALAATPLLAHAERASAASASRRVAELDGLRGLLAIAVLFHHAAIYPAWLRTGSWHLVGAFDAVLGEGGVAMFFMITGYLFWQRLLLRGGRLEWTRLYLGRVFRIGPLYLAAAAAALAVTLLMTRQLNVPWPTLAAQVAQTIGLGVFTMQDVNGYATPLLLAGVTWSLQYEWLFYAALPLLALPARARLHLLLPLTALLCLAALLLGDVPRALLGDNRVACSLAEFAVGMLAGSLHQSGWRRFGASPAGSLMALACLAAAAAGFGTALALGPVLLLGAAFLLIVSGASLFGLLLTRPMRRLGDISYGIYLLHGLVLALLFRPPPLRAFLLSGTQGFVALTLLATLLAVLLAACAHALIELPGQRLGRSLDAWLRQRRAPFPTKPALSR